MKRYFSMLLVLCMVLTLLPGNVFAAEIVASGECGAQGDNVTWTLDSDGLLTISGTGEMSWYGPNTERPNLESIKTVVIMPGVTSIEAGAFQNCINLTSIAIPYGVTSIGNSAFGSCSSLTSITIPDGVSSIGFCTFYGCSSLTSITIPDSVTNIGASAFYYCSSLTSITIPNSVTSIGKEAFCGCSSLTSITIPNSVTSIGDGAFTDCSSLTSITIPSGVASIGVIAFYQCSSLTSITIPNSVTNIKDSAFQYCDNLKDVFFNGSEEEWNSITIGANNDPLKDAAIHYNPLLPPNHFTASEDGWPIGNHALSFGYEKGYRIPLSSYGIFKKTIIGAALLGGLRSLPRWAGSCFGLSLLAVAEYENIVDIRDMFPNNGEERLAHYGYDHIALDDTGQQYYSIAGNDELISIIEKAHVSQISNEFLNTEVFKGESSYFSLLEHLRSGADTPIIVTLEANGGFWNHAVVIEPRAPESLAEEDGWGPGWYGLYLYDPNVAKPGNKLSNPNWFYGQASYLYINAQTGEWRYIRRNSEGALSDKYSNNYCDWKGHCFIRFYDASQLSSEYFTEGLTMLFTRNIFFNASTIKLYHDSELVMSFDDKTMTSCADSYDYNVLFDDNASDSVVRYVGIPDTHFSYVSEDAEVSIVDQENQYSLSTSGACSATVDFSDPAIEIKPDGTVSFALSKEVSSGGGQKMITFSGTCEHEVSIQMTDSETEIKGDDIKNCKVTIMDDAQTDEFHVSSENGVVTIHADSENMTVESDHSWDNGVVTKEPTETAEGVKTFTCTVCGEIRTESIPKLTPSTPTNPFVDVKQGEYYYDPVLWAVNYQPQITKGTSETTFSPDATCTRGQVVTFLWRAKGCPEPKSTKDPFSDVPTGAYYYKAVLWANENGITNGTSKTTFSPENPCTRAHVVTFLWRAESKPAAGEQNPFTDVPAGQYYTDAVLWAVSKNITNGTSPTTFSPDNPCTRGQIVTFLYRDMK